MKLNKIYKNLFIIYNFIYLIFSFWGINLFLNSLKLYKETEKVGLFQFNLYSVIIFVFLAIVVFWLFIKLSKKEKILKINVKDCLLVGASFVFFIILIILYFIYYHTVSFSGNYGMSFSLLAIPYYLGYVSIPWIIANIYTFIKIKESKNQN